MSAEVAQNEFGELTPEEREATRAVERSRDKTTCPSCPSCKHYNCDADGPDLLVNSDGTVYEICPNCWYRFELVTTEAP